jgi:hypothetical protein
MFTLCSNITITDPTNTYYLEQLPIHEVKIKKSRKTLTNTAEIIVPRKLNVFQNSKQVNINTILQRGAAVSIQIGYDGNLSKRFTGFISSLNAQIPLTIYCQDSMWPLKQNSFTKSWPKGTKVADIVSYIYPGLAVVVDLSIGGLIADHQSTAQILDSLRKFGLQCYFSTDVFDNNTLYVDFAGAVHSTGKEVIYDFYQNIIENELVYKVKEDSKIKVVATSTQPNGKKIQLTAGDDDGEIHTLHYSNMDADQLQKIVNAEIDKLKYEGYKGSFTTWGLPEVEPGDTAVLQDPIYPEHDGSYLVQAVDIAFGVNGYRHEVELERKLD